MLLIRLPQLPLLPLFRKCAFLVRKSGRCEACLNVGYYLILQSIPPHGPPAPSQPGPLVWTWDWQSAKGAALQRLLNHLFLLHNNTGTATNLSPMLFRAAQLLARRCSSAAASTSGIHLHALPLWQGSGAPWKGPALWRTGNSFVRSFAQATIEPGTASTAAESVLGLLHLHIISFKEECCESQPV